MGQRDPALAGVGQMSTNKRDADEALAGDMAEIEYFHFLLDCHSIVVSNGAETETMFTGPEALKSVGRQARREILDLFPELADADYRPVPARELAPGRKARQLASRHARNGSALIEQ